ncbi:hypothetical protein BCR42DRAFT_427114 [Absidia repens]|uniref:Uncharacterized protein n=1 Tax=Absidia repens TaxID=90262 RepID=A0A1X2I003_9FUNG|nr:hypothetical protein BCR42DRAFT_427114 [Absidia repens]
MLSVKLKLFEFISTKDKLVLLFMSGNWGTTNIGSMLPTFATSTITSNTKGLNFKLFKDNAPYNFDMLKEPAVTFHPPIIDKKKKNNFDHCHDLYCLHLKPKEYYKSVNADRNWYGDDLLLNIEILKRLDIIQEYTTKDNLATLDAIYIGLYEKDIMEPISMSGCCQDYYIILVGSLIKNKWILCPCVLGTSPYYRGGWTYHLNSDGHVFNIY